MNTNKIKETFLKIKNDSVKIKDKIIEETPKVLSKIKNKTSEEFKTKTTDFKNFLDTEKEIFLVDLDDKLLDSLVKFKPLTKDLSTPEKIFKELEDSPGVSIIGKSKTKLDSVTKLAKENNYEIIKIVFKNESYSEVEILKIKSKIDKILNIDVNKSYSKLLLSIDARGGNLSELRKIIQPYLEKNYEDGLRVVLAIDKNQLTYYFNKLLARVQF